jgi:hypothetical protein
LHGPATQETSCHIVGLRTGIITNRTFARVLLYRTCTEASPRRLHTTFCRVSKSTPVGWRYRFELEDPSASPELQDINKSSPEISFSHSPPPSQSIDWCGCLESPNYSSSNLSGKVQTRGSGLWQQATEAQSYEPSLSPPPCQLLASHSCKVGAQESAATYSVSNLVSTSLAHLSIICKMSCQTETILELAVNE